MSPKIYEVRRSVTFHYYIEANGPKDAIAIAEDLGEGVANLSHTDFRARKLGASEAEEIREDLHYSAGERA